MKKMANGLRKHTPAGSRKRMVFSFLGLIVMCAVFLALARPGVSFEAELECPLEEHTHTEACYGRVLICGLEESETDDVQSMDDDESTATPSSLGDEGHIHTEDCYETDWEDLICGLEEHTHEESCYKSSPIQPLGDFITFDAISGDIPGSDLHSFVTGVTVKDSDSAVVTDGAFFYGETYTFAITFAEDPTLSKDPSQFAYDDGRLYYTLPPELLVMFPVEAGEILLANDSIVGWYDIDTDGNVEVWFGDFDEFGDPSSVNFIDNLTNAHFTLTIKAKFTEGTVAGEIGFGAGEIITVTGIQDPPAGLSVDKIAHTAKTARRGGDESITFTVVVTAKGGTVSEISLTDVLVVTEMNRTSPSYTVEERFFEDVEFTFQKNGEGEWQTIEPDFPGGVMTFDFGTLQKNEFITLEYTMPFGEIFLHISEDTSSSRINMTRLNYNLGVENTAVATGKDAENNQVSGDDATMTNMQNTFFNKTGDKEVGESSTAITWNVDVGDGYRKMNGTYVTDTLQQNPNPAYNQHITGDITVTLYSNLNGLGRAATPPDALKIVLVVPEANCSAFFESFDADTGFVYLVPPEGISDSHPYYDSDSTATAISDVYFVTFDYSAGASTTDSAAIFGNSVRSSLASEGTLGVITGNSKTSRWVTWDEDGTEVTGLEYTISLGIPAGNEGKPVYLIDAIRCRDSAKSGFWESTVNFTEAILWSNMNVEVSLSPLDIEGFNVIFTPELVSGSETQLDAYGVGFYSGDTAPESAWACVWPYDDSRVVTLTYRIPIDVCYFESDTRTLREFLMVEGNYIMNWAGLSIDEESVWGEGVFDGEFLLKKVIPTDDPRVFDYVVTVNSTLAYYLFEEDEPAIFEDSFDPRMEYVEKSFYVWPRNMETGSNYYGLEGELWGPYLGDMWTIVSDPSVTVDTDAFTVGEIDGKGAIWADFSKFRVCLGPEDTESGSRINGDIMNAVLASHYDSDWNYYYAWNAAMEVHYQLRVRDEFILDDFEALNTATIYPTASKYADSYSASASIRYNDPPLSKQLMGIDGKMVDVRIIINPNGLDLIPDPPPELDKDTFRAVDKMEGDLAFFLSTIEVFTQTKTDGAWDGVWTPQAISPEPGTLWSMIYVDAQQVEFILPNETPIMILYKALITVPVGSEAEFTNTITVLGYSSFFNEPRHVVQESSGGAGGSSIPLNLFKKDADTGAPLAGAQFELYAAILDGPSAGTLPAGANPGKYFDANGNRFYHILNSSNTSTAGDYLFSGSGLLVLDSGATFAVVETVAPSYYKLPSEPDNRTFFVLKTLLEGELDALSAKLGGVEVGFVTDNFIILNSRMTTAVTLGGLKSVTGDDAPVGAQFRFTLTQAGGGGEPYEGEDALPGFPMTATVETDAVGPKTYSFAFDEISGLVAGTYWFLAEESDDGEYDWSYDHKKFLIQVDVEEIGVDVPDIGGTLGVSVTVAISDNSGDFGEQPVYGEDSVVEFVNAYGPPPVVTLPKTGGTGDKPFILCGTILMLAPATVLLLNGRRRPATRRRQH